MEKLSRLSKIQLKLIFQSFFVKMRYVRITNSNIIFKRHLFSFKRYKFSLKEMVENILVSKIASLDTDTKSIQSFLKNIKSTSDVNKKIRILYSHYISTKHKLNKEILSSFYENQFLKRYTKFELLPNNKPTENIKDKLLYLFKFKKRLTKLDELKQLPTTSLTSYQSILIKEKKEYQTKHKYGNIIINTPYECIPNDIIISKIISTPQKSIS